MAEGTRCLIQANAAGSLVAGLVACRARIPQENWGLVRSLERTGVPILWTTPAEYRAMSVGASEGGENPASFQGVMLVLRQHWRSLPAVATDDDLWLGVETVRSSGNLGTLLRSAHAAGATGLIVFDRSEAGTPKGVDPYEPSAVRASMGSLFAHRMHRTTHREFRRWATDQGVRTIGASGEAAADYRSVSYHGPTVLMLGDERTGLTDGQRGSCNEFAKIPMAGYLDSLNLAMAGTLMLYAAFNDRHPLVPKA